MPYSNKKIIPIVSVLALLVVAGLMFRPDQAKGVSATNIITTVAGNGQPGFSGDGGPAVDANVESPHSVTVDGNVNIYIVDKKHHKIRKVDSATGIITTIAGTGTKGFSGDGGPGDMAQIESPDGTVVDSAGNVFITDKGNQRIRRIDASTGYITTIAGTGVAGYSGDGGPALAAELNKPERIAVDSADNIYFADTSNHRVRRIDAGTGIITLVAGTGSGGYNGDGILATAAQLNKPYGVGVSKGGHVYIADKGNQRVRRVDASTGIITTIAGTGVKGYNGDDILATVAQIFDVNDVEFDRGGNIYLCDKGNNRIRRIDAITGMISTVVGTGQSGFGGDGGLAVNALLQGPAGLAVDDGWDLYIADDKNHAIRFVDIGDAGINLVNWREGEPE